MHKILQYPDERLRKISVKVDENYPDLHLIVRELKELAQKNSTKDIILVGLSAPQVGENIRVFVYYDFSSKRYIEVINPEITYLSKETSVEWEGCASVGTGENSLFGPVRRSKYCQIKFYNACWQEKILNASNYLSHIIQHEIDHLDGIVFLDKVIDKKMVLTSKELERFGGKKTFKILRGDPD